MNKNILRKVAITSSLIASFGLVACSQNQSQSATVVTNQTLKAIAGSQLAEQNKKIVIDFYNGIFIKHQVKEYSDLYIGNQYIQHNSHVPDGKAPFVDYFTDYFKENPKAKNVIKRAVSEGDLVVLHVHSTQNDEDRGEAIIDIFRVENGKIVEHWDVQQDIPEKSANTNTMF